MRRGGDRAFYSPSTDHIQIPPTVAFRNAAEEACVKVHEAVHASGAKHRLNRDLSGGFGSKAYSFEELIAEIASSFIGVTLHLPLDVPNHANYIGHWLGILKDDKRAIFRASAAAQRAVDYLMDFHPAYALSAERPSPPDRQTAPATLSL
jgi:antirestriction protein ArdC